MTADSKRPEEARARRLAKDALRLASRSETDAERLAFVEIARTWERLAEQAASRAPDEPPDSGED